MSYRNWIFSLLLTSVITTIIANFVGYHVSILKSVPGILILAAIAFLGLTLGKLIPLKLPAIVYVILIGVLVASPISPISKIVIDLTSEISFLAPVTVVGALAGIGMDFKSFKSQSWKMVIIAFLVYSGTYITQALFSELFLRLTHTI